MKRLVKLGLIGSVAWALTLGLHVGSLPGRVSHHGTTDGRVSFIKVKDGSSWVELAEGKSSSYMSGFMDVPVYQVGIPFLFTFKGAEMPASINLSLYAESEFEGKSFVIEKATVIYDSGHRHDIIAERSTKPLLLSAFHKQGENFSRTQVRISKCIAHKRDYTIEVHGFIENGEDDIKIREDLRMLYSEKRFIHLGWWRIFVRIVSRFSA